MKVDRNKGICTDLGRNVLDDCRDYRDDLQLGDPATNLSLCHLQELIYNSIVLLRLEFIVHLIESACPSLLLPNLNTIL